MSFVTALAADIVATLGDAELLSVVAEGAFSTSIMRSLSRNPLFPEEDLTAIADDVERLCRERATAGLPGDDDEEEDSSLAAEYHP